MGAATDVGKVRAVNEDSYLARDGIAVVADGMGGHACGDRASALAIEEFAALDAASLSVEQVHNAIRSANEAIVSEAAAAPEKNGMGTTLTGVALVAHGGSPHWLVFNLGDSRVYRLAAGTAIQLTSDHSEVAELVARGQITSEQARRHPLRNIVTRSLGVDPLEPVDVWVFPPSSLGDAFLACSDGLTNELDDTAIGSIAGSAATAGDAAVALVEAAVRAGGRDNVTAVVLRAEADTHDVDEVDVNTAPREVIR
jgi:protein phosphatase